MQSAEEKDKIHKLGFKLFDYQINTKTIQERFMKTLFWLEVAQMEMHSGPNTPLLKIGYSSELLGVILTFNMEMFQEDRASLMFIDVNIRKNLHLEMKIDPQRILDLDDNELSNMNFESLFLKGAIQFGWFQHDDSGSVAGQSQPSYYETFLKLVIQKWYKQREEFREMGLVN